MKYTRCLCILYLVVFLHWQVLPIFVSISSLAPEQHHDLHIASEQTRKDMHTG